MQDVFIEHMVRKQRTPTTALCKVGIVAGAVVVSFLVMTFSRLVPMLSFFSPFLVMGVLYGAYYLITSMNVEFEYAITNGELDVDQIIAQRKRKRLVSVNCRQVESFGRYKAGEHEGKQYQTKIIACDSLASDDLWHCTLRLKESGLTLVVFSANQKMLDAIKPFLPRPIAHAAFRVGQ